MEICSAASINSILYLWYIHNEYLFPNKQKFVSQIDLKSGLFIAIRTDSNISTMLLKKLSKLFTGGKKLVHISKVKSELQGNWALTNSIFDSIIKL